MEVFQATHEVANPSSHRWLLSGSFADDACIRVPPFDQVTLDISSFWL